MDVSEKRERAAVHRAGKTARRKKTDAFGALFGSASSSAARHEALSMRIRRTVTREGGLCREEPPKERRKRRNIRPFGGSPLSLARRSPPDGGVASSSLSLLCFFRHALWPSLCDASAFFDRSRRHLAACALETEMNGRRRGGMEELMLLLLLPLARSLFSFRLLFSALGGPLERSCALVLSRRASPHPRPLGVAIVALSDLLDGRKRKP